VIRFYDTIRYSFIKTCQNAEHTQLSCKLKIIKILKRLDFRKKCSKNRQFYVFPRQAANSVANFVARREKKCTWSRISLHPATHTSGQKNPLGSLDKNEARCPQTDPDTELICWLNGFLQKTHRRATELTYGITHCYLQPNTGERAPPKRQPSRPVLDLPTLEGWKAELTLVLVIYRDGLPVHRQLPIHLIATRPGVELMTFRS